KIVYEYDFADNDTDASDKNNHGSHIASIFTSVAPDSNIIALKVFKDKGAGSFSDLEKALQWVAANSTAYNIASVNLSIGDSQNWTTATSRYGIGDELAAIASQNIIISAAAGNSFYQYGSNPGLAYPAIDPNVIAVGAVWADNSGTQKNFVGSAIDYTTNADQIASFSQRDRNLLDVFAPGILITGANASGGTTSMGGTSQATAYMTGVATLAQQIAEEKLGRKLTVNEFRNLLDTNSVIINDGDNENDNVTNTGKNYPRVDLLKLAEGILNLSGSTSNPNPVDPGNNNNNSATTIFDNTINLVHTVNLTAGEIRTGIDFGNQQIIVNHAPTVAKSIATQTATEDTAFSFTIPENIFTDIDAGDVLTYSATLENGNALPSWLTFNPTTRTFSGTPNNDNVGSLNVKAIATDKAGATVSDIFVITVENVNDAPIVANLIADQNAKQGNAFSFQIPTNTFTDIDAGDVLTYSATLENGNALPSWLTFNSATRTFSGTSTNDNVGNLNVKAIATDKAGANISDIFVITVENVNDAPIVANLIADQNAKQGNAFSFQIPTNTFTDIDAGDVLTYSATLENGNALPSWLTFNSTTRTFSGTPTNDNVGNFNVKAIATDKAGATVSDVFTLAVENINDAPTLLNAIADQNAKQGTAFNFQIPTNTFTDIDAGDVLTYSTTLENGTALPSWLTFNSTTRTVSGTPTNDNVGNLNIKAIATDKAGATVSDIFTITVENVNDAPVLSNAIADQNAKQGTAFNFQVPTNTFTDIDAGDILTYSATLENGNALPNWLTFNSTTRTFSGTPTNDNVGNLNVKVAATDKTGASVNDTFTIKVQNVNTAPILKNPLLDQTVKVNSTFTFTLPKDTFSDPDAVNPYKNLVIFGDSLSDTGNAYKASGNTFPPSPNYQGRLSNGLIWVDYFAPDLQFTNPSIQNYAFLGANTGVSNTFGQITVPGLLTQIQQFKTVNTNSIGKDGLYVIWAGANDFLNLATDPTQAVTNAVTNISSAITTLAGLGAKEIVVGNLSDLGATPLSIANNNVANARAISIGFNAALTQALTNLEPALNVDLSLVDIFGLSTAFQTNPANYKFTNITQPLITVTTPVNPDQYAFWDDVHPTTRLHQLVTDTFENTLLNDGVIPDLIKYSATLADGSNLPDWLNFNSTTRTFSGTPNTGNVGKLDVKVIATDKAGATVNDIFTLAVNQSTTVGTPGDDKLIATPGSQFDGQNNIVFTGAGKDELDLSTVSSLPNSGSNIVDLGSGDDTIFVNKSDRAFGSDGNDIFDARDGQGNNRMSGGAGDDIFYLGANDRALGGDGKDIFRVSLGGGNLISGGAGADQFWIVNAELPKAANTVLDF
ncbi:MAG: putative Ig domain-containing protein, partial [Nostocales cyanobacterium LacPavin_0920_SED1_MAG_38_18]|nr:putative Ig domain-containing protein [Nostocales cyanobacterium LacPavin_0920_SED1_MAG_38_18]